MYKPDRFHEVGAQPRIAKGGYWGPELVSQTDCYVGNEKRAKRYIAKEAPCWSFLNLEKVYRPGNQKLRCEISTETDVC